MWETSIITNLTNKQMLLEKACWLLSGHKKNPSAPDSQLVALTVELFLVIAPLFPTTKTLRECAIPEYPLAWRSVLTTGLQKVGKEKNFNGKSLRILKMLTIHKSKMAHSFLSHTSDFRSDTPPSSFITCHCTTIAYALTAVWQAITGFTLGVLLMPARY